MPHSTRYGREVWLMPKCFAFHRWTFGIFHDITKFEILLAHDGSEPVEALFFMNFARWREFHCFKFIFKCLVEWLHRREIARQGVFWRHLRLSFFQCFRCWVVLGLHGFEYQQSIEPYRADILNIRPRPIQYGMVERSGSCLIILHFIVEHLASFMTSQNSKFCLHMTNLGRLGHYFSLISFAGANFIAFNS